MKQKMQAFELMRPERETNAWSEEKQVYRPVGIIHAALSVADGRTQEQNQTLRVSSTHRALTRDDVRVGDRFGGYVVDYVITGTRYTQLMLSREEALGG